MNRFNDIEFDPNGGQTSSHNTFPMPDSDQYREAFDGRPFVGPGQNDLMLVDNYISIDSRDRDRAAYPGANRFRVMFEATDNYNGATTGFRYKNIYSIQLRSITVPNTNGVLDQPYLLLDVEELRKYNIMDGTNIALKHAFVKIHLLETTNAFTRNSLEYGFPVDFIFKQASMGSLNSLTLRILKPDGTLFDFGTDTSPPAPVNETMQCSMVFKVTTLSPDTCLIPRHNI